eukprot:COSAG04_NODE_982_length_9008_cov_3.598720_4_plen_513_part_00
MAEAIQLWVRTADGPLSVTADGGRATTVAQLRAQIAAMSGCDDAACRLIFAGKELEDGRSLADYDCENASELNLILRDEDVGSGDAEAAEQTAAMRAQLAGSKLAQFRVTKKIGKKDIGAAPPGRAGYSQSAYVYLARHVRTGEMQFAMKVMLNYAQQGDTLAVRDEFDAETALLSDAARLPPHRHVMAVLHSFVDTATGLPEWNFEADIVNPHTTFVVKPYFPKDLKRVLTCLRRQGQEFDERRALQIVYGLLLAVRHLKSHDLVHRDVKLDTVLLANVDTEQETAVLTDFGMCLDLRKNQITDFRVPMPMDGWRRGGAPIALAPEITLPRPGPGVFLDYSKNDEWAVGIVAHELLSGGGGTPFLDMEHPPTYSDAGYQDGGIPARSRPLVAGLPKFRAVGSAGRGECRATSRRTAERPESGGLGARPPQGGQTCPVASAAGRQRATVAGRRQPQPEAADAAQALGCTTKPQSADPSWQDAAADPGQPETNFKRGESHSSTATQSAVRIDK